MEELAALMHRIWSGWAKNLIEKSEKTSDGSVTVPKGRVEQWTRQIKTDYKDLSEKEKELDRVEARKVLSLLKGVATRVRGV